MSACWMTGIINDWVGQGRAMWEAFAKSLRPASRKEKLLVGNEARKSESLEPQGYRKGLSGSQERPQRGLDQLRLQRKVPAALSREVWLHSACGEKSLTEAQDMGKGMGAGLGVHCRGRCSCQEGPSWEKGLWAGVLTPVPTLRLPRVQASSQDYSLILFPDLLKTATAPVGFPGGPAVRISLFHHRNMG